MYVNHEKGENCIMNKKKKWLSLLTIATSLVLCIISTFGITLAFFGGNASANLSTITLKTGIEIGAAIESSVGSAKVVPGQPVKITATGTVSATDKGSANPNNAVDGVVRAKFNVGNELGTVTIAGNNTDFWTAGGDGYYYLVTAENGTILRTVSKGTSVQIFGDLVVSKNFTNADSGKSVEASVIFEVIQADIYKADGTKETLTVTNATTSTSPLYSSFEAVEYKSIYGSNISTAYYNVSNITVVAAPSFKVKPYAIHKATNGNVYIYYGFEVPEAYSAKTHSFVNCQENIYNAVGGAESLMPYWMQDGHYVVDNIENYENSIGTSGGYPKYNEHLVGPMIGIVECVGVGSDINTIVSNIDALEYTLYINQSTQSGGA